MKIKFRKIVEKAKDKDTRSKFVKMMMEFFAQIRTDNISSYAASCAFFLFLSLVPIIILLCSILPYTPIKEEDVISILNTNVHNTLGNMLSSLIQETYARSFNLLSIAAVATLWSAGKGVNALIDGLNAIEHVKDRRNGFINRAFACLYTLIFLASILVFLLLIVYGKVGKNILVGNYPKLASVFGTLMHFRSAITITLMTIVFMILYAVLPYGKRKLKEEFVGAFFCAASWTAFSYFFSLYVENYGAFSIYGSLTTIIILCFWLYICMFLVFIGANINKYFRPIMMAIDKQYAERNKIYRGQSESLDD